MKYKIYLVASLLLGNALLGFSQVGFQSRAGIYGFGKDAATATIQTEGGESNNFNAIIPGRDVAGTSVNGVLKSDSRASVMRSNGPMYIGGDSGTTMAIYGSVFFDMDDTNTKMTQTGGDINLTGDLVVIETGATATSTNYLYTTKNVPTVGTPFNPEGYDSSKYSNKGSINFVGKWNVQRIQKEDDNGNPILNDETRFNTILNLPTVKVSKEGVADLYNGANAVAANTAEYDPYKMGFVSVATNVAVSINTLDLTGGNRLSVDAISAGLEKAAVEGIDVTSTTSTLNSNDFYKVNYGYLDINEQILGGTPTDGTSVGYGELNMRLYSFDPSKGPNDSANDPLFKNTSTSGVSALGASFNAVFLRGMTSPFDKLYSDYMLYNVLTKPEGSNMTGEKGTITDPSTSIASGQGYFFGLDVADFQFKNVTKNHQLGANGSESRARGGYNFSRYLRQYQFSPGLNNDRFIKSAIRPYGYDALNPENFYTITDEDGVVHNLTAANNPQRFNVGKVEVYVEGGETYDTATAVLLGNPYLVPINIGGILWDGRADDSALVNGYQSQAIYSTPFEPSFNGVKISSNSFQVLHNAGPGTGKPDPGKLVIRSRYKPVISARVIGHDDKYYFNVNYDEVDIFATASTVPTHATASGTGSVSHVQDYYLEPLQLFGIYAAGKGNFTFIPSMKVNAAVNGGAPFQVAYNAPTSSSTRSLAEAQPEMQSETEQFIIPDWFVIEASVKNDVLATDRAAVRFLSDANQSYDEGRDVIKNINLIPEGGNIFEDDRTKALVRSAQSSMNVGNSIYTTSLDGTPLKSNTTGYTSTKEIPLYYVPSKDGGDASLYFSGVSGFQDIKKAWLVDRYENVKEELTEGLVYNFNSQANSTETANRFLLVFDNEDGDDSNLPKANISIYYSNSTLYINGLNQLDAGSIVQIFDVQGRTMGTTSISEGDASIGTKEYPKPLGLGTFIVKIIGKRNFNSKFVNTQNI